MFLVFAFPFLRRYKILTDDALLVRGALDWSERVYPLGRLKAIRRTVSGDGRRPAIPDSISTARQR